MKQKTVSVPNAVKLLWELPLDDPYIFQIYQNVPLEDLTPPDQKWLEIDSSLKGLRFPYIFCLGSEVYLAAAVWETFGRMGKRSPRFDVASIPGLLVVKGMQTLRYQDIVRTNLEDWEERKSTQVWRYHARPVPKRDWDSFCRKRLLENWVKPDALADDGPCFRPTVYGWAMGLSACYTMREDGAIRCTPVCPKERLEALKAPWSAIGEEPCGQISFAQRLQRLNQGAPSDPNYSTAVARQLANISLEDYMAGLPHNKEDLLSGLELDGDHTLWNAAEAVHWLLGVDESKGRDMLWCLACPMERAYRLRRNRK